MHFFSHFKVEVKLWIFSIFIKITKFLLLTRLWVKDRRCRGELDTQHPLVHFKDDSK